MKILGAIFGFMALVVAVIENVAVIFACLLISAIESSRYDVKAAFKKKAKTKKKSVPQLTYFKEVGSDRSTRSGLEL